MQSLQAELGEHLLLMTKEIKNALNVVKQMDTKEKMAPGDEDARAQVHSTVGELRRVYAVLENVHDVWV